MNVMMISTELAGLAKAGGLGDVVDALSRALAARRHDVRVVMPLYGHLDPARADLQLVKGLPPLAVRVGQRVHDVRFWRQGNGRGARKVLLVSCESLFGRPGIYTDDDGVGFPDSLARGALLGQAALLLPRLLEWPVDVLHAHDALAVPALVYRRQWYAGRGLPGPAATVLTIHNLAHQEAHPAGETDVMGLPGQAAQFPGLLEFHGQLNLLKGGILAADRVNTVSPTYAEETRSTREFGCGLEGVLAGRGAAYGGILNGADYAVWDPSVDGDLPATYGPGRLAGKAKCRAGLLEELALAPGDGRPVCGFVGRLVQQKGVDLLLPLLDRLAGDGWAFAILGTGEARLHDALDAVAARHPDKVAFCREFNEALAHRIYAGSDLFLMPSAFEPCGLSQMYALKYGTPPVVRRTGGLADTVVDAGEPGGTGFVFTEARPDDLLATLRRAAAVRDDAAAWSALVARGMACDFGWEGAAAAYEELYADALGASGETS